ncbi:hypothetical protein AXG93_2550s1550 [Marchantia polymorpha subsp. ruderalis]|uniref:Uncharacterized protein n=1 Tax=Marchantia polymorpha subsp. ruderalis TaxID=1480154 RepID=A0A176VPN8_MARPO|nr:hypothetical protein AXG93_2550s1550 [Marchantia polymorpha subsp. ruderalis]
MEPKDGAEPSERNFESQRDLNPAQANCHAFLLVLHVGDGVRFLEQNNAIPCDVREGMDAHGAMDGGHGMEDVSDLDEGRGRAGAGRVRPGGQGRPLGAGEKVQRRKKVPQSSIRPQSPFFATTCSSLGSSSSRSGFWPRGSPVCCDFPHFPRRWRQEAGAPRHCRSASDEGGEVHDEIWKRRVTEENE